MGLGIVRLHFESSSAAFWCDDWVRYIMSLNLSFSVFINRI